MAETTPTVEIWIPGPWQRTSEFEERVKAAIPDSLARQDQAFDIRMKRSNPHLAQWMDHGSGGAFSRKQLAAIADHTAIAEIDVAASCDDLCHVLVSLTNAVKASGGLGVRLGRSGLAHPWERWEAFLAEGDPIGLIKALVIQVPNDDRGRLESFGMNQLGLPDVVYDGQDIDSDVAAAVVFALNVVMRQETPKFEDGDVIQLAEDLPLTVLTHEPDNRYAVHDPFHNRHGVWILSPRSS